MDPDDLQGSATVGESRRILIAATAAPLRLSFLPIAIMTNIGETLARQNLPRANLLRSGYRGVFFNLEDKERIAALKRSDRHAPTESEQKQDQSARARRRYKDDEGWERQTGEGGR